MEGAAKQEQNKIQKTIRAYKSIAGVMNGLWLTQWIWGESGMDMGELLAV